MIKGEAGAEKGKQSRIRRHGWKKRKRGKVAELKNRKRKLNQTGK